MSYYCKKCGVVEKGIKQIKVPVKIRKVIYQFRNIYLSRGIDNKTGIPKLIEAEPKVVKETKGFETVEVDIYCPNCEPKDIKPEVVGEITRTIDRKMQRRDRE